MGPERLIHSTMLSRAAESLYWISRYIERAEDITRLLSVNIDAMLEAHLGDAELGWMALVRAGGDEALFRSTFSEANARTVTEFLLWHPANPNAVSACIARARQNARGAREQISTEMWEHLNRLYLLTRDIKPAEVARRPYNFFVQVRDGSQAFQGITAATMMHGEPYEFIQLGRYIERASQTVSILDMKCSTVQAATDGSPEGAIQLIAVLKSCSAFEPIRWTHVAQLQAWRVAHYLLLSREFPRAVLFCLDRCLRSINTILSFDDHTATRLAPSRSATGPFTGPQRAFGRLCSELEYLDIHEVLGDGFRAYLNQLARRIYAAGEEAARTFFNTDVILSDLFQSAQQQ